MGVADIPLMGQIKGRLGWLDQRQRVIAENVANADTPGFVGRDLRQTDFGAALNRAGRLTTTNPGHMTANRSGVVVTSGRHITSSQGRADDYDAVKSPDSETTLDGNTVVVEEQMLKMAESRMAYDAAIGFYQKSMSMIRMAAKKPGQG